MKPILTDNPAGVERSEEGPIAFLVQRIGPYHHARLRALAASNRRAVHAIEYRADESEYAWETAVGDGGYSRHRVDSRDDLCGTLDRLCPAAVVCVGYADPEIHQAVSWSLRYRVGLVTCSDTTRDDEPRHWIKEALKKRIVSAFGAVLVAGGRAASYMDSLGIGSDRQFRPWDVVDNEYFGRGVAEARDRGGEVRGRLMLPEVYFLCVARFIPKKNLVLLVHAYRIYAGHSGSRAWPLLVLGGGPMESEIRGHITSSKLVHLVELRGAAPYADLPSYYAFAGAVILPSRSDQWGLVVNEGMASGAPVLVSSRCGCAPDLVREDENGFTFEPDDPGPLADRMLRIESMDPADRAAMGRRSREIIAAFSPERFAYGLGDAVSRVAGARSRRAPWPSRVLIDVMAHRVARRQ